LSPNAKKLNCCCPEKGCANGKFVASKRND
jgi:hypothetical protein